MPRLQVLNGKRQGEVFEISPNTEVVIGHRQSAAISIDDPWVSWDHARLIYQPDSASCWIEDLGSTNGTYLNCQRIKKSALKNEDIIFLGKTHVIFLSPISGDLFSAKPIPTATGKHTAVGMPSSLGAPPPPPSSVIDDPFPSSSAGPSFGSGSGLPSLHGLRSDDPFASTGSPNNQAPLWEPSGSSRRSQLPPAPDPFSESSVDPFSSGPDYSGANGGLPARRANPFAETRGDEQAAPLGPQASSRTGRSLSLSGLGEDKEVSVPGPSSHEISNLIKGGPLGDNPFEPSPPRPPATPTMKLKAVPGPNPFGKRPSEMRTQPISTDAVNQLVNEHQANSTSPPSPGGALFDVEPSNQATRHDDSLPAQSPPPPPPPPAPAPLSGLVPTQGSPGGSMAGSEAETPLLAPPLAFDRARLQDEVQRLRLALQAVQKQNPQAVQVAAQALRDQELGRLAQRVAELERDVAQAREDLKAREQELNLVTEEMIEKEDTIDQLRRQAGAAGGVKDAPQQDWSSLEF